MIIKKTTTFVLAAIGLIQSVHGADSLLSSNNTGGDAPGAVATLGAGASYTWQNLGTGNGPGNTDVDTLAQDLSFTKMKNGGSAAFGGNFATYSVYGGNVGQTSVYDLGVVRSVNYVTLSAKVLTNQMGVGYFTAYTSTDGTNFTLFGRWSETAPADSSNATLTIDPPGSVNARYVMFYTNRYAVNVGEVALPGQANYYMQTVLGEQMVFGNGASYSTWASSQVPIVTGGPDGDSDNDGIKNLVEYALNLNPAGSDGSAGTFSASLLSFAKRAEAVSNGDVNYEIESSTTLVDGTWGAVIPTTNTSSEITYILPPPGPARNFARIKITLIPRIEKKITKNNENQKNRNFSICNRRPHSVGPWRGHAAVVELYWR